MPTEWPSFRSGPFCRVFDVNFSPLPMTLPLFSVMSTYNHSSSYNRTYEKKVVEEVPRVRLTSIPFTTHHVLPVSFSPILMAMGSLEDLPILLNTPW